MELIQTLPLELVVVVVWAVRIFCINDWEHCSEDGIAETPIVFVEDVGDALLVFKVSSQFLMCASIWIERIGVGEMQLQAIDVHKIGKGLIAKKVFVVSAKFI